MDLTCTNEASLKT